MDNDNTAFDLLTDTRNDAPKPKRKVTTGTGQGIASPGAFSFSGRARRSTYWTTWVVSALFLIPIGVACANDTAVETLVFLPLLSIPLIVWSLAVAVRRCHDLGWSGIFVLLNALVVCIPVVGWIASTILWICLGFMDGQPFTNQYGPDPKGRNYSDSRAQTSQQQPPVTVQVTNQISSAAKIGDQLRELKRLQNEGLITQEEFDAQKEMVLARGAFIFTETERGADRGEQEEGQRFQP